MIFSFIKINEFYIEELSLHQFQLKFIVRVDIFNNTRLNIQMLSLTLSRTQHYVDCAV